MSSRGAAAGQILLLGHIPCRHSPSLWHNLPYSWFCREIIVEGRSGPRWPQAELFLHPSSKCRGCNTSPLGCLGAFEGKHRIHRSLQSDTVPQLRLGSVEGLGWLHLTHPRPPVLLTRRSCNLSFPWIALRGSQASHPGVSQEQNLNYPPFSQRTGLSGSVCGFPGASECHLLGEGLWSGGCGCRENIHGETEIGRERPRAVNNTVGRGKQRIEHTENCIQTT